MRSLLVANRGEIARRIFRTARAEGLATVAVFSDADADAPYVHEADTAVRLPGHSPGETYLRGDLLIAAALSAGADAVHPGYGFLSEDAGFAADVLAAGLTWVGPPVGAIAAMGDKLAAKALMVSAGVPCLPGVDATGLSASDLAAAGEGIGYPVLVKASAGGGGRGMRIVAAATDLAEAVQSAHREATSAFGDGSVFLERYVERARHVEVQVMADQHGTCVALFERDCSVQRRHQKVLEEAPSPAVDAALRTRLCEAAVAAAQAVGYTGAGTVEFIVRGDAPDEPFFMEMNTRLQVEHPVTELVTGLDLVEQQLRVAAGARLTFGQDDVRLNGHAVEVRVYAEDPARGFLPTGGPALLVREPVEDGVRIDSSLVEGAAVGTTYDPMLSKVVAWGPDRSTALAALDRALAANVVLGVGTNTAFLRRLLQHPDVRAGRLDTGLVERELDGLVRGDVPVEAHAAFALYRLLALDTGSPDPWAAVGGWRLSGAAATWWTVAGPDGQRLRVAVTGTASAARVVVGDREVAASAERLPDGLLLTVDGSTRRVLAATAGATTWLHLDGTTHAVVDLPPERRGVGAGSHDGDVRSPMPGAVIAVRTAVGDEVASGDVLLVVEAMKMEHALTAPVDGSVTELGVRVGDQVAVDQLLAVVTPAAAKS